MTVGASVLHKISLGQKFLVLGVIAVIIAVIPATLYFQNAFTAYNTARLEHEGSSLLVSLSKVVQFTQIHRGLSAGALNGNKVFAERRPIARDNLTKALDATDAAMRQLSLSSDSQAQWSSLVTNWVALEKSVAGGGISSAESTKLHTKLVLDLFLLNESLLDSLGYSQNADFDTHFLIQASLVELPMLTENLGLLRAIGSGFLTSGKLTPEGRAGLQALQKRVLEVSAQWTRDLKKSFAHNPTIKNSLEKSLADSQETINRSLTLLDKALISAQDINYPASAYFDDLTKTIDGLFLFNEQALQRLDSILEQRAADIKARLILVAATLAAGLLAGMILAAYFIKSITYPVSEAVRIAGTIASGDLRVEVPSFGSNELGQLMLALEKMRASLEHTVVDVLRGSESVATASEQIAQGNLDLSSRTEEQASALTQTAGAMEELSTTVGNNADHSREANLLARNASIVAAHGGEVVGQVVHTMQNINESSKQIADIISVIDGIAFQTNILALNAAVEAARAGEQGRGFAVVASEVRSLAGRSAEAAKQIKGLISESVERVNQGSDLVDQAGATVAEVVQAITKVTNIMDEISSASDQQSSGVTQVGEAVVQLDHTTQQNAALVEEMSAAAASLSSQAQSLLQTVSVFKIRPA
jgi:methyl-accepting chemotaxis protein